MPTCSNKSIVLVFFKNACILINALILCTVCAITYLAGLAIGQIRETCEVTQTIHIPTSTEWPNSKTPTLWLAPFLRTSSIISSVRQLPQEFQTSSFRKILWINFTSHRWWQKGYWGRNYKKFSQFEQQIRKTRLLKRHLGQSLCYIPHSQLLMDQLFQVYIINPVLMY